MTLLVASGLILLLLSWVVYICRPGRDVDSRKIYSCFHRGWRRLAFWAGDVCWISHFPWVTWDKHGYAVSHEEWLTVLRGVKAGDILLATKKGFFISNNVIPGLFKHAAIFTQGPLCVWFSDSDLIAPAASFKLNMICDIAEVKLAEAISEGVVEHHPAHARADMMIVLRPKGTSHDIDKAVHMVKKVIGCDYDARFKFDIEKEVSEVNTKRKTGLYVDRATRLSIERRLDEDLKELKETATNIKADFDVAFSCTEAVAFAYWHMRHALRLYRQAQGGRRVISADQFVNHGLSIVWTNVTLEEGKRLGLHEEGCGLLEEYWKSKSN